MFLCDFIDLQGQLQGLYYAGTIQLIVIRLREMSAENVTDMYKNYLYWEFTYFQY